MVGEQGLADVLALGDARRDGEERRAGVLQVLPQGVAAAILVWIGM